MGLYLRQEHEKSELQKRIAAELAEKAKRKAAEPASDTPDGVDDSRYMEDTKATTSLAWVWLLITFAFIGIIIWLVVIAS